MPYDKVRDIGHDYRHIFGFLISRETDWNDVLGRITDKTGMPDFQRGYHLESVIKGESYLHSLRYVGGYWKGEMIRISHQVRGTGQEEDYVFSVSKSDDSETTLILQVLGPYVDFDKLLVQGEQPWALLAESRGLLSLCLLLILP